MPTASSPSLPPAQSDDHGGGGDPLRQPLLPLAQETPAAKPERICIDGILQKYCGEFGPWQLRHFVLTSLAWALEAFHTMVMIFADREPDWRCTVGPPGCDASARAGGVCGLRPDSWEWTEGPWSSTAAEWGLVCGEKYKVGLVQALFFGGCMIGEFSLFLLLQIYFLFQKLFSIFNIAYHIRLFCFTRLRFSCFLACKMIPI